MSLRPTGRSAALAAAAVGCGLLAALLLPAQEAGLGYALVALALAATVAPTASARSPFTAFIGFLAVALAAMAVLRTAGWLVALDLVAAGSLASVAMADARAWPGVRRALVSVYARLPLAPFFLGWASGLRLGPVTRGGAAPALRGLAIATPLVWLFGWLFMSADPAFADLADSVLDPEIDVGPFVERALVFALVASLPGALVLVGLRGARMPAPKNRAPRDASDWLIALSLLVALFAAFVAVQITVLFAGHDHVLRTEGLTYSEYAREGFGELVAAATLTLGVVALAARFARPARARQRAALRALLGALCLLTLVILASALWRLDLYEEAFGFTRLRLMGQAIALWLGAIFVLVLAAGALRRADWLPRAATALTGVSLLALSLGNPDAFIAAENIERYRDSGKIDTGYLQTLSADAAPTLAGLPDPLAACVLARVRYQLADGESFSELSVGRARARTALDDVPSHPDPCDA